MFVTLLLFAALASGSATPPSGRASGTFSAKGKDVKITHAAAFTDQKDKDVPIVLILSDREVPASEWKDSLDLMMYRHEHPFLGVAFWINKQNQVFRCDYYDGSAFPTSSSGIFELKLDRAGKSLSGSAHSTAAAAKLEEPVKLDAAFNTTLK